MGPHTVSLSTQVDVEQYLGTTSFQGTVVTIHGANDLALQGGRTVFIPPDNVAYISIQKVEVARLKLPFWATNVGDSEFDCAEDGSTEEVAVYESEFMYVSHLN
jgi:hypothetical protein